MQHLGVCALWIEALLMQILKQRGAKPVLTVPRDEMRRVGGVSRRCV